MQQQLQPVTTQTDDLLSTRHLSTATTAKQLRMVRISQDVENQDQTAANCSVIVKVNLHQYLVGSLATGI